MTRLTSSAILGIALLALAACSDRTPTLMNLTNTEAGPDEFSVVPNEPLQIPGNLRELPTPAPGARNLADPDPEADAIAALGGNPARAARGSNTLMQHVGRFGISADIRPTLAAEDEEFRRRNDGRILERMFGSTVYFRAYRSMSLDRYAELERLRRAGVRTPTAPPAQ
ncbi:Pyruvate/2-oxoglutarate dehydrogenase complex, dihydrolipoamide acyltransferase (E2) component [Roseibacterium elongatum DSM 19469]|uniref:Pyruvate/2-oxoglutarate dehydrogenase complex, dihydrolipoamide acyltransferase (E2) component n=1 Tax=Roseicyclus elongatus DSM 19469 TaxID=1294273 RepID=W8SL19_9RHOB|nr:DUF3035 domain-containing protein [Roseibacterium elongatum]AHM03235.1 Pyruvate/2-oxoglutarate dehydrogenase complex, dihydrolipoamide acyltransferase (E2) component [Roseibacterium elongatum DSM 19469]